MREYIGGPRNGEIGADHDAAGVVAFGLDPFPRRRGHHAGGPQHRARLDPLVADLHAVGVDSDDARVGQNLDAEIGERAHRGERERVREMPAGSAGPIARE